jgi:hypothetical protein
MASVKIQYEGHKFFKRIYANDMSFILKTQVLWI